MRPTWIAAGLFGLVAIVTPRAGFGQSAGEGVHRDTVVVSLAQAERLALRNHPTVQQSRLDVTIAESRQQQARDARYVPKLELQNIWGPIPRARGEFTDTGVLVSPDTSTSLSDLRWFTEVDLAVVQPLYTFGRLSGLADAAGFGVEASRSGLEASSDEVRLQVRKLYWGLLLGQELVDVADGVLNQLAEADSILADRYDEGSATQNDMFKFQIFKYQVRKRRREAVDRHAMAEAGMRAMLGLEGATAVRTDVAKLTPLEAKLGSLEQYVALAAESRPEVEQLQAGIAARSALARSKRGELFPQLFLGADIKWNKAPSRFDPRNPFVYNPTNFFRPGIAVGFRWNMNLFQTRDELRLAEHETARLRNQVTPLSKKIRLEVQEAYLAVLRARSDVEESEDALKASSNWFRAESQTFDLGLSEIKDLVDAFQANIEMQTEHLGNVFRLNTALAELSRAVGRDLYVT